ncbi:MAG: hypothetical protein JWL61_642 [Gemmatimonadetes bacterium]|nr:hypothetical protein [Gemmatimonadota bacterium]
MTGGANEVISCEVCGGSVLASVLDLGLHPLCDDLVPVGDPRICREYPIEILFCAACNTAHQRFQVPKRDLFPASYHYRSRFTADVLKGMSGLVDSCEQRFGSLQGKLVLDVGCNDGSLLDFFRDKGAITVGIEPTDACRDATEKGHATYCDFFTENTAAAIVAQHGRPDFITFTNVFAHIEDLRGLLRALRLLMSPDTVIVIENHYLGSVLDGNQFDTFYHEHPRTYSYSSFTHIAASLGVSLLEVEFPSRYGGNIRVFLGNREMRDASPATDRAKLRERESRFGDDFGTLRASVEWWRTARSAAIDALVARHGRLRAKAFPARAAILIKLLGLDERTLIAVHEKPGSLKVGTYVPGTRIPIVSDDDLFALADASPVVLNLAWHIPREIRDYLLSHGYAGEVVDVVGPADFANAGGATHA